MRANEFEKINTTAFKELMTPELKKLGTVFNKAGHEIRLVGGVVRDLALKKFPKDVDLATDANPNDVVELLNKNNIKNKPTGIEHGTITAIIDKTPYEITTLRADKETDGRRAKVQFVKNWKQDAERRDLTYNAMSLDFKGKLYDYFGGMDDLQDKVSAFVGDPDERIKEDFLRILRYFRFQSKLEDPKWDQNTIKAIANNADDLKRISVERIWSELKKMLVSRNVEESLRYMGQTGVAKAIDLPVENASMIKRLAKTEDPIVPLAVLVDDITLAETWKMSKEETQLLRFLVQNKKTSLTKESAIDFIHDGYSKKMVLDLINLQGKKALDDVVRNYEAPQFPVQGRDLIAKGMKPGVDVGRQLAKLRDKWKASGYKLSKDQLLR
jgi:tRNA nucleotidyltransferase/poly(A) polymerase